MDFHLTSEKLADRTSMNHIKLHNFETETFEIPDFADLKGDKVRGSDSIKSLRMLTYARHPPHAGDA